MLENVKDHLNYDPETGEFTWLVARGPFVKNGDKAGGIDRVGYVRIKYKGKKIAAHRLAWYFVYGEFPEKDIDHINRIKTDNRIENLRDISRSENVRNTDKKLNCSSQYRGVCWHKRVEKWGATIKIEGNLKHLGYFIDEEEAALAYNEAASKYYPEFSVLNIVEEELV